MGIILTILGACATAVGGILTAVENQKKLDNAIEEVHNEAIGMFEEEINSLGKPKE